ncbi:helix-turn-helix domain-containing protein [bacterium]|jgi:DNA-binding XRE family transcriptional regulator|nr:helix-turn-helix domain-containing protein [bacterium]
MSKLKLKNADDLLKKQLKNKTFKEEYEALEEEYLLAKQVIKLRLSSKMTQKELAQKAGTSQPAIARLESGNYRSLSLSFLNRVGFALGATPHIQFKKTNQTHHHLSR